MSNISNLSEVSDATKTEVHLAAFQEWRFEAGFDSKLIVRLTDGTAELFGTELAKGRDYEFSGQNAAIFTYFGCVLEWEGECSEYTATNNTMSRYANIHFALNQIRQNAANSKGKPPVVLILGDPNSGKSTLAKILVSYATKQSYFPVLVNLDPQTPIFSPPGSLIASAVSHILDVEDNFGLPAINGPAQTHHKQPLVYNYGLPQVDQSPSFYRTMIEQLSKGLAQRLEQDTKVRNSGVIIDSPSYFSQDEHEQSMSLVAQVVSLFGVNSIFVVGKERLSAKLQRQLPDDVQVLDIVPSGGVTKDDDAFLRKIQRKAIAEYFFGTPRQALSQFTVSVPFKDLVVYRPIEENDISSNEDSLLLTKIEPSAVLQNCLLAVVNAELSDPVSKVEVAETLGYVQVVEAEDTKKLAKILLPVPGSIPRKALIMGAFRYHE